MRWDFFHKSDNGGGTPAEFEKSKARDPKVYVMEIDTADLTVALKFAYENGLPKGTHRLGCIEVQNDLGVFSHKEGKRVDASTPRKAKNIVFCDWDGVEHEYTDVFGS